MGFSAANNFYYCPGTPFQPHIDTYAGEAEPYSEFPAKATGNDHFDASPCVNDWYETVKLNYGVDYCDAGGRSYHYEPVPSTWGKMTDISGQVTDSFLVESDRLMAEQKKLVEEQEKLYEDVQELEIMIQESLRLVDDVRNKLVANGDFEDDDGSMCKSRRK